jgi:hypothetical protein
VQGKSHNRDRIRYRGNREPSLVSRGSRAIRRRAKQTRDPHRPPDLGSITSKLDPRHHNAKFDRVGGVAEGGGAAGDRCKGVTSCCVTYSRRHALVSSLVGSIPLMPVAGLNRLGASTENTQRGLIHSLHFTTPKTWLAVNVWLTCKSSAVFVSLCRPTRATPSTTVVLRLRALLITR